MFSPVREFAREKLDETPDPAKVLRRHATHFAQIADRAAPPDPREPGLRVLREAEDLFAAAEFSISDPEGDVATGIRALIALEPVFSVPRGAALRYLELLDRALARAADDPRIAPLDMRLLQIRARHDAPAGRAVRALRDLDACLRDAVARGDVHREGLVELDLGVVHHLSRDWGAARRWYEAALERLRTADDPLAHARCIGNLGALDHDEGDFAAAARLYRRAIARFEQVGEVRHRANLIGNLAVLEQELGNRDEARRLYGEATALLEPLRDARVLAITLGNRGVLELELGFAGQAVALHERCLGLLAGSGDLRSRALCLVRLAAALAVLGRAPEAEAHLDHAESISRDPLVIEAAALTRGFAELSWAERSLAAGDRSAVRAQVVAVQARVERAVGARDGGHALHERSDDLRSTLRILSARLVALRAQLEP
jgi:tetratricopeptide (TPR) repeat protein